MAIFAAVGILETKLALPAQSALKIPAQANAHLVHALVQPLHAGMLAGASTMFGGAFSGRAAAEPERGSGNTQCEDNQGKAHPHSVGAFNGSLKLCTGSFYSRAGPLR